MIIQQDKKTASTANNATTMARRWRSFIACGNKHVKLDYVLHQAKKSQSSQRPRATNPAPPCYSLFPLLLTTLEKKYLENRNYI